MKYIDSWLSGLGLEYIIPKLEASGITTPKRLAQLTLRDIYDVVGVDDEEDRKKLYFLIQRLQAILTNKAEATTTETSGQADVDTSSSKASMTHATAKTNRGVRSPNSDKSIINNKGENKGGTEYSSITGKAMQVSPLRSFQSASNIKKSINGKNNMTISKDSLSLTSSTKFDDGESDIDTLRLSIQSDKSDKTEEDNETTNMLLRRKRRSTINTSLTKQKTQSLIKSTDSQDFNPPSFSAANNKSACVNIKSAIQKPSVVRSNNVTDETINVRSKSNIPLNVRNPSPIQTGEANISTLNIVASSSSPLKDYRKNVTTNNNVGNNAVVVNIEDMAIRVVVRKRPISRAEISRGDRDVMEIQAGGTVLVHEPKVKVDLTKVIETQEFIFDDSFEIDENNEHIYNRTVKHLVSFVFEGGKASCFAYGQTGSGKTFTMMGETPDMPLESSVNSGLYVLAARDIFQSLNIPEYRTLQVFISCFEIYGGKLFDLLNDRGIVKCLEDAKQQVQLPGLTEHNINDVEELLNLMGKAHTQRSTGSTGANETSSRSHQVMQIVLREPRRKNHISTIGGKLSFIDLAGSERGADTNHSSKQTRMEGAEINTSLLALKEVIRSLERKHGHTPFRGSKLTQVLKDSFVGEKTRTCMIACVSPSNTNCEHTLNTLRYADRVKEHQASQQAGATPPRYPVNVATAYPSSMQLQQQQQDNIIPRPTTTSSSSSSAHGQKSIRSIPRPLTSEPKLVSNIPKIASSVLQKRELQQKGIPASPSRPGIRRNNLISEPNPPIVSPISPPRKSREIVDSNISLDKLGNTALIQETVELLSSHRLSIAEMVEVMKDEMELVQNMENAEDRNVEHYIDRLEQILDKKNDAIDLLKTRLFAYIQLKQNF